MNSVMIMNEDFLPLTEGLDCEAYWEGDVEAAKSRCGFFFSPDEHWLFEFTGIPSTLRYYRKKQYRDALHCEINALLQKWIGRKFFDEDSWQTSPKRIENLFGCEMAYHEGGTPWLMPATDDPDEFARILDRVEQTNLDEWSLPEDYRQEWDLRKAAGKRMPTLGCSSRGPATVSTSVISPEHFFLWVYDYPELILRFRNLLTTKTIEFNRVLRKFSGKEDVQGWWIADDNSALFNLETYCEFCSPVLEGIFAAFAAGDSAPRYQHSDSAMGHLLDEQYRLGIRAVNYGPTVDIGLIRQKMPDAHINGHMPPFLLRNGSPAEIRARVEDDFRRGGAVLGSLTCATAGSLAAGTGIGRMRYYMQLVREICCY